MFFEKSNCFKLTVTYRFEHTAFPLIWKQRHWDTSFELFHLNAESRFCTNILITVLSLAFQFVILWNKDTVLRLTAADRVFAVGAVWPFVAVSTKYVFHISSRNDQMGYNRWKSYWNLQFVLFTALTVCVWLSDWKLFNFILWM